MRKAILALVVVGMFIGASGVALAGTEIWTSLNAHGETWYNDFTQHGGTNWQRTGDVESGSWYVDDPDYAIHFQLGEQVNNDGNLQLNTYLNAPEEWNVQETKELWADGETLICKDLQWTTNTRSVFDGTTTLAYPTIMEGDIMLHDFDNGMTTHKAFYQVTDDANAPVGQFTTNTQSNNEIYYHQAIGDNLDPLCVIPTVPDCVGNFWCGIQ